MNRKWIPGMLNSLLVLAFVVPCAFAQEPVIRGFPAAKIKRLEIKNGAGNLFLSGSKRETIKITAVRVGNDCSVEIDQHGDEVRVKVERDGTLGECRYNINVELPEAMKETSLKWGSGDALIKGLSSDFDLKIGSGKVKLDQVSGNLRAQFGSGTLAGNANLSDLNLKSGTGKIDLSGVVESLNIRMGSGKVRLALQEIPRNGAGNVKIGAGKVSVKVPKDAEVSSLSSSWGKREYVIQGRGNATYRLEVRSVGKVDIEKSL